MPTPWRSKDPFTAKLSYSDKGPHEGTRCNNVREDTGEVCDKYLAWQRDHLDKRRFCQECWAVTDAYAEKEARDK